MNTLLLDALYCRNQGRPPIWLMRQAGRYMAKYRALRAKHSFLEMCHQPELIAEVTWMPLESFGMDAAILFSDILVIPEALGVGLHFEDQKGPIIHRPLKQESDIGALPQYPDMAKLSFVYDGIKATRQGLNVPLIGFCGAPFTVASYMIEGGSSRDLKKTKQWMFNHPIHFHSLLKLIADWSIAYLKMQIEAGVQAIQIFDSWANFLAYSQFTEFSLAYLEYMLELLKEHNIPIILFCRGSSVFAPDLARLKPQGIGLDWNCSLPKMREHISYPIALQGNLDPDLLYAPLTKLEQEVDSLLDQMKNDKGFIFNLGHGILPDMKEESIKAVVDCVKRRGNASACCHTGSWN